MKTSFRVGSFVIALLLASIPSQMSAQSDTAIDEVADRLANAKFFSIGGVGFVGRHSSSQEDYETISYRPTEKALEVFEHIYATGNSPGRS